MRSIGPRIWWIHDTESEHVSNKKSFLLLTYMYMYMYNVCEQYNAAYMYH